MHPHDFVIASSGGSLMPILVFVIWIVASIIAQSQKKKKRQQSSAAGPKTTPAADAAEELKRQIETIFRQKPEHTNERPQPGPADSAHPHEEPVAHETLETKDAYDTQDVVYENYEAPLKKPHVPPAKPSAPVPAVPTFQVQVPLAVAHPELKPAEDEYEPALSLHSINDARTGFLWSEVLGPPIALRE